MKEREVRKKSTWPDESHSDECWLSLSSSFRPANLYRSLILQPRE